MPLQTDIDYSDEIAALPKHAGYTNLPLRSAERWVTLHYSGVNYPPANHEGELARILSEARYQMGHNYGSVREPAYVDGLLYDVVILSDGTRVKTRRARQQLWHCGNKEGNARSWAVHLMLGPLQDATPIQWSSTLNIFEQLSQLYGIPKSRIVGHNEWPRSDGLPQPSPIYKTLPRQSECPGRILHQRLAQWREAPMARLWVVTAERGANVREKPTATSPKKPPALPLHALFHGNPVEGDTVEGNNLWVRRLPSEGGGYVWSGATSEVK